MKKSVKTLVFCSLFTAALGQVLVAQEDSSQVAEVFVPGSMDDNSGEDVNEQSDAEKQTSEKNKKKDKKEKNKKDKKSNEKKTKEELAQEKEKQKQAKKLAKTAKQQYKDKYTGWIYIPEKKITITKDDIKIVMNGQTGSFCLYAIPERGNSVPLLSTYDVFSSTFFSVKIGRKEYRLNRENGVKSEARRTPYGAQMAYTIPNEAQVVVDFSFLPSIATSSRVDMLRVTVYTINLGKHTQSFAVKSVFDTILGENTGTHFSTYSRSSINTEIQFLDMEDELWVRSKNETAAIQFLLKGKGISEPQYVTLSNKDAIAQTNWVPAVQDQKSFSSVLSYNNSALGINWKTAYLDPMKTDVVTFYISVAIDGNEPAGKNFLAALEEGRTALSAKLPDMIETTNVASKPQQMSQDDVQSVYKENMPVIPLDESQVVDSPYTKENSSKVENDNPVSEPAVELILVETEKADEKIPVSKKQLDPEYIQNILDHIAALDASDNEADKAELAALNAELDAIFSVLQELSE